MLCYCNMWSVTVLLMPSVQVWWYSVTCVIYLIIPYHLSCANSNVALCLLTSTVFILQHMWMWEQHHHQDHQWVSELCCYAGGQWYQCGCTVQQESINMRYYLWAFREPFFPMTLFMISVADGALLLIISIIICWVIHQIYMCPSP